MTQNQDRYRSSHKIKSKYLGTWNQRTISIKLPQNKIIIDSLDQSKKVFPLNKTNIYKSSNCLQLKVQGGRNYQISDQNSNQLFQIITNTKDIYNFCNFQECNQIMLPRSINYNNHILNPQNNYSQKPNQLGEVLVQDMLYPKQHSYLIQSDWEINQKDGGLRLISEQKISMQTKIAKFLVTKFLATRSLNGIGYPVFAMKSQSMLQTWAKGIGAAPLFLSNISTNPIQRLKKFVTFIFSVSRQLADINKPFNPTIGETYQAQIAGFPFSAEQTSHHPPQSSFILQGKDFKLYGTIQLQANIGLNCATGVFQGDMIIQFKDGGKIFGHLPPGQMRGYLFGENLFCATQSSYAYDPINQLVCTYKLNKRDIFNGYIGKLKEKYLNKFKKQMQCKSRFDSFQAYKQKQYQQIYSKVEVSWSKKVTFDDKLYLDFEQQRYFPYMPVNVQNNILQSDSRFRQDIILKKKGQLDASQTQKQRIQQQQRYFRKLRQKKKK